MLAVDHGMAAAIDINRLNAAPIIAANVANSSGRKPGEVFQKPGKAGLVVLGIGPVRQLQFTKPRRVAHRFVKTQLVQPQLGFEELLGFTPRAIGMISCIVRCNHKALDFGLSILWYQ